MDIKDKNFRIEPFKGYHFKLGLKYKFEPSFSISKDEKLFKYYFCNRFLLRHGIPFNVKLDYERYHFLVPVKIVLDTRNKAFNLINKFREKIQSLDKKGKKLFFLNEIKNYNKKNSYIDRMKLTRDIINKQEFDRRKLNRKYLLNKVK